MLARDDKDKMYEPKQNKKALFRIFTVAAYVLCVSLAAIMLSLYYVFFWDPAPSNSRVVAVKPTIGCGENRGFNPSDMRVINCFPLLLGHFIQNDQVVSESEFRKITGIEKDVARAVDPSLGPSIPTAVINKDRVFQVKEVKMVPPVSPQNVDPVISSSSSTTNSPETVDQSNQDQEGGDDMDYQGDEMEDEFDEAEDEEEEEASGGGAEPEFKKNIKKTVLRVARGRNATEDKGRPVDEVMGNEI